MRASDCSYFLEIASIASTAEMETARNGALQFEKSMSNIYSVQGGLNYIERPSIIYRLFTGEKFVQILKLDPQPDTFKISIGLTTGGDDEIIGEIRPIMSAMFYLGQSIELPEEIIKQNRIHIAHDETGKPFDWQKVLCIYARRRSDPGIRITIR
jgi:hypothetical protein